MENQTTTASEPEVRIDINGKEYAIPARPHTIVELKTLAQIPLADELERVVNQRLIPLADDASVAIRECEWFVSHPRDCQSS